MPTLNACPNHVRWRYCMAVYEPARMQRPLRFESWVGLRATQDPSQLAFRVVVFNSQVAARN